MGVLLTTSNNGTIATQFDPKVDRQFQRSGVLFQLMQKKTGAGDALVWDARFSRATPAAAMAEGADVAGGDFQFDPTVKASLPWGSYRSAFAISGLSMATAMSAMGSPAIMMEKFQGQLEEAAADIAFQMAQACWTGSGSGAQIAGVASTGAGALVDTGTYASISRATYAEWAGNYLGTAGALTLAMLTTKEDQIFQRSRKQATAIVTTPTIATKYANLFSTNIQLQPMLVQARETNLMLPTPSGYTGMNFRGIPVLRDPTAPAGTLAFVNDEYMEFVTLPGIPGGDAVVAGQIEGKSTDQDALGDIYIKLESLGKTGDSVKFQLVCYAQARHRRANACGLIEGIT